MLDVEVIDDPAAAVVALDPVRARLLAELVAEPASAAALAERVGLARQKVNYHLRTLEAHGLVRVVEASSEVLHLPQWQLSREWRRCATALRERMAEGRAALDARARGKGTRDESESG